MEQKKKEDKERSNSVGTGKSERKQNLKELTCNEKLKHFTIVNLCTG